MPYALCLMPRELNSREPKRRTRYSLSITEVKIYIHTYIHAYIHAHICICIDRVGHFYAALNARFSVSSSRNSIISIVESLSVSAVSKMLCFNGWSQVMPARKYFERPSNSSNVMSPEPSVSSSANNLEKAAFHVWIPHNIRSLD